MLSLYFLVSNSISVNSTAKQEPKYAYLFSWKLIQAKWFPSNRIRLPTQQRNEKKPQTQSKTKIGSLLRITLFLSSDFVVQKHRLDLFDMDRNQVTNRCFSSTQTDVNSFCTHRTELPKFVTDDQRWGFSFLLMCYSCEQQVEQTICRATKRKTESRNFSLPTLNFKLVCD